MANNYSWDRNYPIPENIVDAQTDSNIGFSGWRTESMGNPVNVFIDIYDLLDHLVTPGNMQLRGRRGTGKTMYFLKAQFKIGEDFTSKNHPEKMSAYVDLKSIHDYKEVPSLLIRAEMRYRRIVKAILLGTIYKQTMKRYCLQDQIQTVGFIRRRAAQNKLKQILEICDLDDNYSYDQIDNIVSAEQNLLSDRNTLGLRNLDAQLFPETTSKISKLLYEILEILKVKHLIVYIDEYSSPTVPLIIQIPLLDRLANTFNSENLSLKIATVPGTTVIYDDASKLNNDSSSLSRNCFEIFDFEAQLSTQPQKIQTGIFEIFLRNLTNSNPTFQIYLDKTKPENGFNKFVSDLFEKTEDFTEFLKSGDGLPRQLLETFYSIAMVKKSSFPNNKINRYIIQLASRQSLKITYQSQIRGSKQCEMILSKIYEANSRVIKVEKIPAYDTSLALLTHWGFIYASPIPQTIESEISSNPLVYFFTSYRTEIANQMSHSKNNKPIKIDDLTYIAKDKFKELYPKAKLVVLS